MDRARSTIKKYCLSYCRWCRSAARHGLKPLPAEGCYFALYLSEIISTASTPSQEIAAVYGVSWAHRKVGIPDPASHPLVVQAVGAAKRLLAQAIARKDPIKLDHLKEIHITQGSADIANHSSRIYGLYEMERPEQHQSKKHPDPALPYVNPPGEEEERSIQERAVCGHCKIWEDWFLPSQRYREISGLHWFGLWSPADENKWISE